MQNVSTCGLTPGASGLPPEESDPRLGPRARGLTMIEMLTVVAILGLIIAVLVAVLFPSDDRRVKAEAERLAAYCEAAGGEAKMSEGGVRVVLEFDGGAYRRESARIGARVTDLSWNEDERVRPDRVRAPIAIIAVQVADAGTLETGTAWIVWQDTKTRGAVVVLKLNEAIYSVVVDPATGQVRVEKGRATLPDNARDLKRRLFNPEFARLAEGTDLTPGQLDKLLQSPALTQSAAPPGANAPSGAGGAQVPAQPAGGGALVPDETPVEPQLPPIPDPPATAPPTDAPPAGGAEVPVAGAEAPATQPPSNEDPCASYPCDPKNGMNQMCVVLPGDDSEDTPRCVADPRGFAYMARKFSLGGFLAETNKAELIEEALKVVLNDSGYKLQFVFPPRGGEGSSFNPLQFPMHLVQGGRQVVGDTYQGVENVTTARRSTAVLDAPEATADGEEDALSIWVIWPSTGAGEVVERGGLLRSQQGAFTLILPWTRAGQPCFWQLTTVLNVVALLVPAGGGKHKLIARVHTCLGEQKANIPVGGGATLASMFREVIDPLCDTNGDSVPDGWPVDIDAEMKPIEFSDDPGYYQNAAISPSCN